MYKNILKVDQGPLGNLVTFNWYLIDKCQLKCPYCSSVDFNNNTYQDSKVEELVLRKLKTMTKPFQVDITGGEPTLNPKLKMILRALDDNPLCEIIDVHTNFRKKNDFYFDLDAEEYKKVNLIASYHAHAFEPNEFTTKMIDLCSNIKHLKVDTNINLTTDKTQWQHLKDVIRELRANNVVTHTNTLNETSSFLPQYDDEFFDFFKEELSIIFTNKFTHTYEENGETKTVNLNENEIRRHKITYKGMRCEQKHYRILLKGEFQNSCTQEFYSKLNLKDIGTEVVCPLDRCNTAFKYHYKKETS